MAESFDSLMLKFPILWDKNDFNFRNKYLTLKAKQELLKLCNSYTNSSYTLQWLNYKIKLFRNRLYRRRKQNKTTVTVNHDSSDHNYQNPTNVPNDTINISSSLENIIQYEDVPNVTDDLQIVINNLLSMPNIEIAQELDLDALIQSASANLDYNYLTAENLTLNSVMQPCPNENDIDVYNYDLTELLDLLDE